MPETKFNPSHQVERIREILVGREMGRIERRLFDLETSTTATTPFRREPDTQKRLANTQQNLQRETQELKVRLQKETAARKEEISRLAEKLTKNQENLPGDFLEAGSIEHRIDARMDQVNDEITSLIDARTREILHHLQNEILQWKNQMDRDLQSIRDIKVDKKEITTRFSRLAAAAMEDHSALDTPDGYLL